MIYTGNSHSAQLLQAGKMIKPPHKKQPVNMAWTKGHTAYSAIKHMLPIENQG